LKSKDKAVPAAENEKKKGILRENIEAIVIAIILALIIRTFFVQAFKIPSGSMENTLLIGDQILVNKFIYGVRIPFADTVLIPIKNPQRGDIVVFETPEDKDLGYFQRRDFIKRVVGVEGDVVEVRDKKVYVNNEPQPDDFTIHLDPRTISGRFSPRDNFGPVTVPKNSLFVMGDSRDNSHDSRFWGFVPMNLLKGKAFIIYWSWDKEDTSVRWNRLGRILH
jgi:signal peptidase I